MYSGTSLRFYCSATKELRIGSIHCMGRKCPYQWKISVLQPQCDVFLNLEELIEITQRDGTTSNPWYRIFLGEVSFTDLKYQNDEMSNEILSSNNL